MNNDKEYEEEQRYSGHLCSALYCAVCRWNMILGYSKHFLCVCGLGAVGANTISKQCYIYILPGAKGLYLLQLKCDLFWHRHLDAFIALHGLQKIPLWSKYFIGLLKIKKVSQSGGLFTWTTAFSVNMKCTAGATMLTMHLRYL